LVAGWDRLHFLLRKPPLGKERISMNSLILLAALTAGQCEGGVCKVDAVEVSAAVGKGSCERLALPGRPVRRVAGLVRTIVHAKPLRSFVRHRQPLRRLARGLVLRRCR